jgi:thiamine biosynthesis lipoprotein
MKLYRQQFHCMGCPCEAGLFSADANTAKSAIANAENEVRRLDKKYSHYRSDSYISQLQIEAQQPGGVAVDAETASLLNYAETQFDISQGLFDITAGHLTRLWHKRTSLPKASELSFALKMTGWTKLRWRSPRLFMPKGMRLELGGLVKEYAADRAALMIKRFAIHSAYIELGGDIHVTAPQPGGKPWNLGVRNPAYRQKNANAAVAGIPVFSGGLATSGDYERASHINGKNYGHIIHPGTGWPIDSFRSVSILAPSCLLAGSLTTLAMLMGHEDGLGMLSECGLTWHAEDAEGASFSGSSYDQQKNDPRHPSLRQKLLQPLAKPTDSRHLR